MMGMMGAEVTWEENAVTVKGTGGKLKGVDLSMIKMPDAAMTLAVAALFADGPTTIRDVARYFHSLSLALALAVCVIKTWVRVIRPELETQIGAEFGERRDAGSSAKHPPAASTHQAVSKVPRNRR